ncbi:MAG: hypothetical protein NTZ01_02385, partial [Verrucomicrobia bacterium]|nr:hypothetical protein [Verrucomicrobiota bacterium]
GQVLGFDLDLQGRVGTEAGRMVTAQAMPLAPIWRSLERALKDLGGPAPRIQAEFNMEIGRPEESQAEILITASHAVWKGVRLQEVEVRATVAEGGMKLEKFRIGLERGQIEMMGWADFQRELGGVEYTSNADLAQFAPAAGKLGPALQDLRSQLPPQVTGKIDFGWKDAPGFLWQNRLEMGEFRLGLFPYRKLVIPWVTDGRRWMMQGLKLEASSGGILEAQLTYDGKAELKGSLKSDLDLKGLAPLFGPSAAAFWRSLDFLVPPKIDGKVTGAGLSSDLIRIEGRVDAGRLRYKGVEMESLAGNYVFASGQLTVKDLQLSSGGGQGTGQFTYGLDPETVVLKGVQSTLPVQEFAPIFGEKFRKTMEPYKFAARPTITLDGKVDLEAKGRSNLWATVKTKEGMNYEVAGRSLRFYEMDMTVEVVAKKVIVKTAPRSPAAVLGGKVEVEVEVEGDEGKPTQQTTRARLKKVGFGPMVEIYFGNSGYAGELNGSFLMAGSSNDWRSWEGSGQLSVEEGVLPGMGAFAQAMNAPAEWVGATGQEAEMDFTLKKGKLDVGQLQITSVLVVTTGHGVYDIAHDQLEDFIMRQNLRGPVGVPFFFVSQMFQVEGNGSLKNPVWKPRHFQDK